MQLPPICFIDRNDAHYPYLLGQIKNPPEILYYQGELSCLNGPCLSVVGSRRMSGYGEAVLRDLLPPLAKAGFTIVSGLAYGIDAEAHRVALRCGGKCAAVLGSGLRNVYPKRNLDIFEQIIEQGGCVLSEYEPEIAALAYHFPRRNRIVAGLSTVTLIVEAGRKSGTLITATCAHDAGREVCVVPGDIRREQSQGVNDLLKKGYAQAVTSSEDILQFYNCQIEIVFPENLKPALTGSMASLYDLISQGVESTEKLKMLSGLGISEVQSVLSVLELDGYIYLNGSRWLKT